MCDHVMGGKTIIPGSSVDDACFFGRMMIWPHINVDVNLLPSHLYPGAFFVEMALEAAGGLPVTLTNLEFKQMLRIPLASKGETPLHAFLTTNADEDGEALRFAIRSCPVREKRGEELSIVEHCTGRIVPGSRQTLLEPAEETCKQTRLGLRHDAFGYLAPMDLQDVGKKGLQQLVAAHAEERFDCKER